MTITSTLSYLCTVGPIPKLEQATEYFSCYADCNKSAKTIAKAIHENIILIYGSIKTLISDIGTEYKNGLLKEICNLFKTQD